MAIPASPAQIVSPPDATRWRVVAFAALAGIPLAGSPLEGTFEKALLFAEGNCEKTSVLAIRKENELVRNIGFGGHCAAGQVSVKTPPFISALIFSWSTLFRC